jgi:GAF domain-containing protein
MSERPIEEVVTALHGMVAGDQSLNETLERIAVVAVEALGADMAGLTLLDARDRPTTAVFTDEIAPEIDQAQYEADRGPCLDAFRLRTIFRVDSTDTDERWPEFARAAQTHGIHSSLSLPLLLGDKGIGALNLYARPQRQFSEAGEAFGQTFGDQAAVAVANGVAYWEKATLAEQLAAAMASRAVIEQAKGIIMATSGCSPDEAFQILRSQSQAENVKLRDVASEIVERQQRPRS